ncbi:MAG: class I SAM-dependent methyltransferase [Sedimentisphaerales bacterium]|nr:class I SAM-dependent methyltransferase [Sedimentisphaerales bacterium]
MDHIEVGRYWNENAEAWTRLARAGYDVYRDYLNTPGFFAMLPEVRGLKGLDIGCGEGYNTRQLAQAGAAMTAVDISEVFIGYARESERETPLGIDYQVASAVELPFENESFDFSTAFMSLLDIPETEKALAEAYRVLRPGGFLQFSITHPCFDTPHRRNLRDEMGKTYAIEVGEYFRPYRGRVSEWTFTALPEEQRQAVRWFRTPCFYRTLSSWLNLVIKTGFAIEEIGEPTPDDATVAKCHHLQDAQVVAYFLHVRGRKTALAG